MGQTSEHQNGAKRAPHQAPLDERLEVVLVGKLQVVEKSAQLRIARVLASGGHPTSWSETKERASGNAVQGQAIGCTAILEKIVGVIDRNEKIVTHQLGPGFRCWIRSHGCAPSGEELQHL